MAFADALATGRVDQAERAMSAEPGWGVALVVAATGAAVWMSGACVLADPPPTLPLVAEQPPQIQNALAVPPVPVIRGPWPSVFSIPVLFVDPTQTLYYEAFFDYTPLTPSYQGASFLQGADAGGPAAGNLLLVQVILEQPLNSTVGCHVIEIVMAFGKKFSPHDTTATIGGGSTISWAYNYNPSGDCPLPDAGWFGDGSLPDAGDASAAGGP